MSRQKSNPREPVALDVFLQDLEDTAAGEARAAAQKMDDLERSIDHLRDVETQYRWFAVTAALMFVAGTVVVLYPSDWSAMVYRTLGPLTFIVMIGTLPVLGGVYAFTVKDRTRADLNKAALNKKHFVPHNAYYFPAEQAGLSGRVVFFQPTKSPKRRFSRYDAIRPGQLW